MKLDGFTFVAMYAVRSSGRELDLHNDYDFVGLEIESALLWLRWRRVDEVWVKEEAPSVVEIEVQGFSRVRFRPAPDSGEVAGGQTLGFIGQLHPEQWEEMEGCLDSEDAVDDYDLIVGFEDGTAIKIRGGTARLRTGEQSAAST